MKKNAAAHASFDDILVLAGPVLAPVCEALRARIAALHPGHVLVVWPRQKIASFGTGPKKMSEHYAYIAVQRSHVNLGFYRGTTLPDPQALLEGTGQRLRHVKLAGTTAADAAGVVALLRAAIAERQRGAAADGR